MKALVIASIAILLVAAEANAIPITYTVNRTVGTGTITGTIQTDGTLGILSTAHIVDWNLHLTNGLFTTDLTKANSGVLGSGMDLSATATNLVFNFSGANGSFLLFQKIFFSGQDYYCLQVSSGPCLAGESIVPSPGFHNAPRQGSQVIAGGGMGGAEVPEPRTLVLVGSGMIGLGAAAWRRRCSTRAGRPTL